MRVPIPSRFPETAPCSRNLTTAGQAILTSLNEAGFVPAEWSPRVDVLEREGQFVVRADLPGLSKEDINHRAGAVAPGAEGQTAGGPGGEIAR